MLVACGEPGWTRGAERDDARELGGKMAVGRSVFAHMEGDAVQRAYRRLHARCIGGDRRIGFEYRCDAPHVARTMRMSLTPMRSVSGPLVLYHSVLIAETPRPAMGLFDPARRGARSDEPLVTVCTWCHDVRWDALVADGWVAPVEFYRRGGSDSAPVSHGICPPCYERVVETDGF